MRKRSITSKSSSKEAASSQEDDSYFFEFLFFLYVTCCEVALFTCIVTQRLRSSVISGRAQRCFSNSLLQRELGLSSKTLISGELVKDFRGSSDAVLRLPYHDVPFQQQHACWLLLMLWSEWTAFGLPLWKIHHERPCCSCS